MQDSWLIDGPVDGPVFLFAHGAGAPMDSPFMAEMAALLSQRGIRVVRFEFPYMAKRRETGKKSPPNRQPLLLETYRAVADSFTDQGPVFLGGKSMGGRMASMLAAETAFGGVICMGYPFHPPGKPEKTRLDHFPDLKSPALILQGTRDPFGKPEEVAAYDLPANVAVQWLEDGDHGLKPRKSSGRTEAQNLEAAAEFASSFIFEHLG